MTSPGVGGAEVSSPEEVSVFPSMSILPCRNQFHSTSSDFEEPPKWAAEYKLERPKGFSFPACGEYMVEGMREAPKKDFDC